MFPNQWDIFSLFLVHDACLRSYFKNSWLVFHRGFQTLENNKSTRPTASCFHQFSRVWKPRWNTRTRFWNITWNTKHEFLKLLLQQKKISLNYHLNKVSQFNYYIWDVKCAWCAWSYHLTAALWQFLNIHQLMSRCYLAVCQFWANTLLRKANGEVHI